MSNSADSLASTFGFLVVTVVVRDLVVVFVVSVFFVAVSMLVDN